MHGAVVAERNNHSHLRCPWIIHLRASHSAKREVMLSERGADGNSRRTCDVALASCRLSTTDMAAASTVRKALGPCDAVITPVTTADTMLPSSRVASACVQHQFCLWWLRRHHASRARVHVPPRLTLGSMVSQFCKICTRTMAANY